MQENSICTLSTALVSIISQWNSKASWQSLATQGMRKIRQYTMGISQPEVYQREIERHFHTNRPNLWRTVKIRANRTIDQYQYRSLDHPNDRLPCYGELCSPEGSMNSHPWMLRWRMAGEVRASILKMQVDFCHYRPFQDSFVPIFRDIPQR